MATKWVSTALVKHLHIFTRICFMQKGLKVYIEKTSLNKPWYPTPWSFMLTREGGLMYTK